MENTDKLKRLGIKTTSQFGDKYRDFLDSLKESVFGKYVGFKLNLKENELIYIQEKSMKTIEIYDYSEFPINGTWALIKDSCLYYENGGKMNEDDKIGKKVYIEFLNKDKRFKKDIKYFNSYEEAVKWAKENFESFNQDMIKYKMAEGGFIENENKEMVANNNKQIAHHTQEMSEALKNSKHVPAWVVAKVNRSASDLSDATHYLDGQDKMAKGGSTPTKRKKVAKVMREWKEGKLHSGSKKGPIVEDQKQAVAIALSEAGLSKKMKEGGTIYDKIKSVDNWKFTNGYGFIFEIKGKKIGFLAYNSGDENKKYPIGDVLNVSALKNLSNIIDNSIILHIQAYFYDKATKMTKMELSGNNLEMLIITNHNVNSFEIFKQDKKENGGELKGWKHKNK